MEIYHCDLIFDSPILASIKSFFYLSFFPAEKKIHKRHAQQSSSCSNVLEPICKIPNTIYKKQKVQNDINALEIKPFGETQIPQDTADLGCSPIQDHSLNKEKPENDHLLTSVQEVPFNLLCNLQEYMDERIILSVPGVSPGGVNFLCLHQNGLSIFENDFYGENTMQGCTVSKSFKLNSLFPHNR